MGFFVTFKKITYQIIAVINLVVVAAMCMTGYAGYFNTITHPTLELLSLAFPIPLLVNLAFLLFWLILNFRYAVIPLAGMLLCWSPIRAYCPINLKHDVPEGSIKVLSYNVHNYYFEKNGVYDAAEYVINCDADIVCLQETNPKGRNNTEKVHNHLSGTYPYGMVNKKNGGERIAFYSKYPILWHEELPVESKHNMCVAYCLKVDDDSVLVVNCHLESIGLVYKEKEEFREFVERKNKTIDKKTLAEKLMAAGVKRALQMRSVARYIRQHPGMSVILCGDFNDSPNSRANHIIGKYLENCYTSTGNGVGFTYKSNFMYFRIDNIYCSDDFEPYRCVVDSKINASDHYPVICWMKKTAKAQKNQ